MDFIILRIDYIAFRGFIMSKNRSKLIAYNDLRDMILEPGFCTLCGACEAACPTQSLKIVNEKLERLHDCSEYLDLCPICYDICPHTDALLFETLRFVADAPHRREKLGNYIKIILAQSTNPALRDATKSGGVVNELLNFAINEKIIDSAITSEVSPSLAIKVKPLVSLVPDDMLSAIDSKIVPSAVAEAFGRAVFEHGKVHIAFVGVPCHILALRKLEAWQHKLIGSLEITIGLFCLWTFSLGKLLEYLLHEHKISANEIQNVDLAVDAYVVTTEKGVISIPLSKIKPHIMSRCRTCIDFTSELADLSIGGARPLKDWSIVIIRTQKGEKLLNKAVEKGVIAIKDVKTAPESFAHLIQLSSHKEKSALQEIAAMRKAGAIVPTAADISERPRAAEISILMEAKVADVMTKEVVALPPTVTVDQLLDKIAQYHHIGYPVVDKTNKILGIITLQDAMKVPKKDRSQITIGEIANKRLVIVFPDSSVAEAFDKMSKHNIGRVLVVDRVENKMLKGILTRSDVMHTLGKNI
jgi:coenzyme F420 hydrogenase subunit beta